MKFGRRVCWRAMRASMGRRQAMSVLPSWRKALCARSSISMKVKPHKVRYYLERRDADFEAKMAEVLCVYREVALRKESCRQAKATGAS